MPSKKSRKRSGSLTLNDDSLELSPIFNNICEEICNEPQSDKSDIIIEKLDKIISLLENLNNSSFK